MNREEIETKALDALHRTNSLRVPVPVDVAALRLGLRLEAAPLGEGISGLLVIQAGGNTIGYNNSHPFVRQRFTIAHEVGHYILHADQPGAADLFIDTTRYVSVYLRNEQSSRGEKLREIQANQFAAALLMPGELLRQEIYNPEYDSVDEEALCTMLADKFQVSIQAMSIRLGTLNIL